jgi:uncharacterized protein
VPAGDMRRIDREMSADQSEQLLNRALVGRVGTAGPDGIPYVTPMNFVYDAPGRVLFFHCATTGHMLDNLSQNPRACFEVDEPGDVVATGPAACDTSHTYRSVICFGHATVVAGEHERARVLEMFVEKYIRRLMPGREFDPEMPPSEMDRTEVIAMRVDRMTGKLREQPRA